MCEEGGASCASLRRGRDAPSRTTGSVPGAIPITKCGPREALDLYEFWHHSVTAAISGSQNLKNPAAKCLRGFSFRHAPAAIRTRDLWLRRPTLYPAELRALTTGGGISRVLSRLRGGDHFSGSAVAGALEQPTRDSGGAGRSSSPIWPCSEWGLPCRPCHQERGALLPHPFTLTCASEEAIGGLLSVALSVALRRPGVTRHPALWSSDFPRHPRVPRSSLASRPDEHHQ